MIQYPKSRHVTLPDVVGYKTDLHIKREPHKSIFTRKKTRVGDTNDLLHELSASTDRIMENVNVYQRGVDPFVALGTSNQTIKTGSTKPSYYPHRIMKDGAFRFPIECPADFVPLSRQPTKPVSYYTNPQNYIVDLDTLVDNNNVDKSLQKVVYYKLLQSNVNTYLGYKPLDIQNVDNYIIHNQVSPDYRINVNTMTKNGNMEDTQLTKLKNYVSPDYRINVNTITKNGNIEDRQLVKLKNNDVINIQSNLFVPCNNEINNNSPNTINVSNYSYKDIQTNPNNYSFNLEPSIQNNSSYIHNISYQQPIQTNLYKPDYSINVQNVDHKFIDKNYLNIQTNMKSNIQLNPDINEIKLKPTISRNNSISSKGAVITSDFLKRPV